MKNLKVYVVGGSLKYSSFIKGCEVVDDIKSAQVVIFTGGEDVTPAIYGCKKHPKTNCNKVRDEEEKKIFERIRKDQLVLGICRGLTMAHVKQGEFDGNAEMPTRSQAREEILSKVQRLGIETKFLPMRGNMSVISPRAP